MTTHTKSRRLLVWFISVVFCLIHRAAAASFLVVPVLHPSRPERHEFGGMSSRNRLQRNTRLSAASPNTQDDNEDHNDDDDSFYKELRKAKKEKLGFSLPTSEELEEAAENSQNEFLNAMQEATQEFQAAKDKLGADEAVDLFMKKIQKADQETQANQEKDDEGMDSAFQ